jgi:hypothetical protein
MHIEQRNPPNMTSSINAIAFRRSGASKTKTGQCSGMTQGCQQGGYQGWFQHQPPASGRRVFE